MLDKSVNFIRYVWMRLNLQNFRQGRRTPLRRLYLFRDPWQMESEREQYRFRAINKIILDNFGNIDTLLEIGCGEGHQTKHLQNICRMIHGVDISELAVRRAQERVPQANLTVGDLLSCHELPNGALFDLVVASEVLYYIHDSEIPAAINKLRKLGAHCLVSYYDREIERLDPIFSGIPHCQSEDLEFAGTKWRVRWWTNR